MYKVKLNVKCEKINLPFPWPNPEIDKSLQEDFSQHVT